MSATTKKKHVRKEMLEDFTMPKPHQTIVQIVMNRGSNLHQVLTPDGKMFLASLPTQFRKSIWIKRGDFVVVDPIVEGDKVKAEIVRILYSQHIREIKLANLWPAAFDSEKKNVDLIQENVSNRKCENECADKSCQGDSLMERETAKVVSDSDNESEDDLSDIPPNTNRPAQFIYESDDESSDDGDDDDNDEMDEKS